MHFILDLNSPASESLVADESSCFMDDKYTVVCGEADTDLLEKP